MLFSTRRCFFREVQSSNASVLRAIVVGALGLNCHGVQAVLKPESFPIDRIYVPVKRRKALRAEIVQQIAESILEIGQQAPIHVRPDDDRLVLVEGLHRLEACKALGETTIMGLLVSAEVAHQGAHQRMHLPHDAEAEAERQKMARLRKLRLEQEAAEKLGVTLRPETALQDRPTKHTKNNLKATPRPSNGRTSGSIPMTLSEWRAQKERNGGRY
jgi:ParB-like chromosome segregation protein Spo0J